MAVAVVAGLVVALAVVVVQLHFAQSMVGHAHVFANLASALAAGLAVGNKNLLATAVFEFAELVMVLEPGVE